MIVRVNTHPFGTSGAGPREALAAAGLDVRPNPHGRRLKAHEVAPLLAEAHGVVAGTEPYTADVLAAAPHLRVLSRVGVGLDNVDLAACRERGIVVTYTPEAPADAVAELTLANILNLLRKVPDSDTSVRQRAWNRYLGLLAREATIGILGLGRIGRRVARLLRPLGPRILGCDLAPDTALAAECGIEWVDVDTLFAESDLVTLHVPLTPATRQIVSAGRIARMRLGAMLINTSRGAVVDEHALAAALSEGRLGGAALDVFHDEPYHGPLTRLPNTVLTAHIGASARACRHRMELEAAQDCARVLTGEAPRQPVPLDDDTPGGAGHAAPPDTQHATENRP